MTVRVFVTPDSTWSEEKQRIKTSDTTVLEALHEQFSNLQKQVRVASENGASCNIRQECELGGLKVLFIALNKKPTLFGRIKYFLS